MISNNKNKTFISYLTVLISLFILVFITKWQFAYTQEKLDEKSTLNAELSEKKEELNNLNKLKTTLGSSEWKNIEKYLSLFREDEIIKYIYDYAYSIDSEKINLHIKWISFSEGKKNELWFIESSVNLSVRVRDNIAMMNLLNFLISDKSKYNFIIESFTYPNDWSEEPFNLNIPLKVFYK